MCINSNVISKLTIILYVTLQTCVCLDSLSSTSILSSEDIEKVESLIKLWSPLVWLAPDEKFMPGSVSDFLSNVHAERAKTTTPSIQDIGDISNLNKYSQLYNTYYTNLDKNNDLMYYDPITNGNFRSKRNFRDKSTNLDYIFDLPIEENSLNWFLVTNEKVEDLVKNETSFIYGKNPTSESVPVYAVVSVCDETIEGDSQNDIAYNLVDSTKFQYKKYPYIPLDETVSGFLSNKELFEPNKTSVRNERRTHWRGKRQAVTSTYSKPHIVYAENMNNVHNGSKSLKNVQINDWRAMNITKFVASQFMPSDNIYMTIPNETKVNLKSKGDLPIISNKQVPVPHKLVESEPTPEDEAALLPAFHVTYWMFYPYSQGKILCTISLGPLGPLPIPLIFGMCLGNKKEFGSHVGDWEHMSLSFNGRNEPEEMYVSAHDAGAFYSYDRLTGTFEFKSQETRKGILQHPNFPRTVLTSSNHPVLFSAEGSHGLWTAPGKHRFVRVPRLYDVNGFGTPWSTWKNVQILHTKDRPWKGKRSLNPNWFKYRGRWGNPKSKCHPLKKIGLHFCQWSDGPTGIPRKEAHFDCTV